MPILCIVVCAFIWTIDFESGCIKYIFSQISRKNWMITKIVTSVITIFFLYFILGVGLTSIAYLLGNKRNNNCFLFEAVYFTISCKYTIDNLGVIYCYCVSYVSGIWENCWDSTCIIFIVLYILSP